MLNIGTTASELRLSILGTRDRQNSTLVRLSLGRKIKINNDFFIPNSKFVGTKNLGIFLTMFRTIPFYSCKIVIFLEILVTVSLVYL